MQNLPAIFLMGPTATGKTDLAAALHDSFRVEIISVDAAQVYRGMDIGTAKPDAEFLRAYPHHLIDICAPHESYNAARFCADARALIAAVHARGNLPVLAGGTMFYFAALEHGLSELPHADAEMRAAIAREMEERGADAMHADLARADAKMGAAILPSDRQRIARALEIFRISGRPPSEVMARNAGAPLPLPAVKFGLFAARADVHARIEARFLQMLQRGLVDEVRALIQDADAPHKWASMRALGYRQTIAHLRGEFGHDELVARGTAATRQFAKRQLTWMRRQRNLVWVDAAGAHEKICAYLHARGEFARFVK